MTCKFVKIKILIRMLQKELLILKMEIFVTPNIMKKLNKKLYRKIM